MSIFSGLFKSRDKPKDSYDSSSYSYFFGRTHSGKRVNDRTALQHIIVYACVRVLSEAIAQLPLHVYKYTDNGKERVTKSLYSFIEPDFNFELFQKHKITDEDPDVIYVKPGHELIDISADWIVNLWHDGALTANSFSVAMDREDITQLRDYLRNVSKG